MHRQFADHLYNQSRYNRLKDAISRLSRSDRTPGGNLTEASRVGALAEYHIHKLHGRIASHAHRGGDKPHDHDPLGKVFLGLTKQLGNVEGRKGLLPEKVVRNIDWKSLENLFSRNNA